VSRALPFPRAGTAAVVTIAAVALVASFRATPHIQKGRLATVRPAGTPAPVPTSSSSPTPTPSRSRHSAASGGARPPATRRITGAAAGTPYGIVQVRITMRGSRIVAVDNLALPFDRNRSQEISQVAGPLLRTEALRAQSASLNVVSGATYTSDGYAQSLQSALDRAHA
jgi:uncharacterized protein with FMN-binding domain